MSWIGLYPVTNELDEFSTDESSSPPKTQTQTPQTPKRSLVKPHLWPGQCLFTKVIYPRKLIRNTGSTKPSNKILHFAVLKLSGHQPWSKSNKAPLPLSVAPLEKRHLSLGCTEPQRKIGTLLLGKQTKHNFTIGEVLYTWKNLNQIQA